jgi:hypothetical protein
VFSSTILRYDPVTRKTYRFYIPETSGFQRPRLFAFIVWDGHKGPKQYSGINDRIVFLDGNSLNDHIDNLLLLPDKQSRPMLPSTKLIYPSDRLTLRGGKEVTIVRQFEDRRYNYIRIGKKYVPYAHYVWNTNKSERDQVKPEETIRHCNGDTLDDNIINLMKIRR